MTYIGSPFLLREQANGSFATVVLNEEHIDCERNAQLLPDLF